MSVVTPSRAAPGRIVVVPILDDLELYRVVRGAPIHRSWLTADMTSNYERRARPRRVERFYAIVHMAISTFTDAETARALARRYPRLGTHVARLSLPPNAGFCVDVPAAGPHRSLWGEPARLAMCVTDIERV
jgi:hypothetical protein